MKLTSYYFQVHCNRLKTCVETLISLIIVDIFINLNGYSFTSSFTSMYTRYTKIEDLEEDLEYKSNIIIVKYWAYCWNTCIFSLVFVKTWIHSSYLIIPHLLGGFEALEKCYWKEFRDTLTQAWDGTYRIFFFLSCGLLLEFKPSLDFCRFSHDVFHHRLTYFGLVLDISLQIKLSDTSST